MLVTGGTLKPATGHLPTPQDTDSDSDKDGDADSSVGSTRGPLDEFEGEGCSLVLS